MHQKLPTNEPRRLILYHRRPTGLERSEITTNNLAWTLKKLKAQPVTIAAANREITAKAENDEFVIHSNLWFICTLASEALALKLYGDYTEIFSYELLKAISRR